MEKRERYKISQFCMVLNGAMFKSNEFINEGVPVLKTSNIKNNRILFNELSYVSDLTAKKRKKSIIMNGDILFPMTGNIVGDNPDRRVGRVAIFKEDGEYILNQRLCIIRPDRAVADSEFLAYYLSSAETYMYFMNRAKITGKQASIALNQIQDYTISLPDITTQRRISQTLRALDLKIVLCDERMAALEREMQTYYDELFVRKANSSWKAGTLSDIGKIVSGGTPSKKKAEYFSKKGIAWITPKDLSNYKLKFISHGKTDISELGYKHCSATKMPKGTVLFSSRAPIGYMAIATKELTTNQGFRSIIPNKNIGTAFTYYLLKSLLPNIESRAVSTCFQEISGTVMKQIPVIIPDNNTLQKFSEFCNPKFNQQLDIQKEKIKLEQLKRDLISRIISDETYDLELLA